MDKLKLGHMEVYVKDLAVAVRFYQEILGFEITVDQGNGLVWLVLGDFEVLLRRGNPPGSQARYEDAPTGIVLYTGDLEASARKLTKNGLAFLGTVDTEKCLTFTDPDGNWFQLVNPEDF